MAADVFLDTNVLVYKVEGGAKKAAKAEDLLERRPFISVQVLNEFVNVAQKKLSLNWDEIHIALDHFRDACRVVPLTVPLHERAVEIAEQHLLGMYDALIVAAAELAGCDVLYTEDLNHGQRIGRVVVRNPFKAE